MGSEREKKRERAIERQTDRQTEGRKGEREKEFIFEIAHFVSVDIF